MYRIAISIIALCLVGLAPDVDAQSPDRSETRRIKAPTWPTDAAFLLQVEVIGFDLLHIRAPHYGLIETIIADELTERRRRRLEPGVAEIRRLFDSNDLVGMTERAAIDAFSEHGTVVTRAQDAPPDARLLPLHVSVEPYLTSASRRIIFAISVRIGENEARPWYRQLVFYDFFHEVRNTGGGAKGEARQQAHWISLGAQGLGQMYAQAVDASLAMAAWDVPQKVFLGFSKGKQYSVGPSIGVAVDGFPRDSAGRRWIRLRNGNLGNTVTKR